MEMKVWAGRAVGSYSHPHHLYVVASLASELSGKIPLYSAFLGKKKKKKV